MTVTAQRRELIAKAIDTWKRHLVDLTGNNRLIYFRQTKTNALNLDPSDPTQRAALLAGGQVRLTKLFANADEEALAPAIKAIRAVDKAALANREELGIETLFLTTCRLSWDASKESKAKPNAPVMMAPAMSHAVGGSQSDFELQRADDWVINETLLLFLEEQYGVSFDRAQLDDVVEDHQGNPDGIAAYVADVVRNSGLVKDVALSTGVVLGNFKYQKMPMVKDLENNAEALAQHNLIAAIAGDRDATLALQQANAAGDVDERLPNYIEPESEFIVLDADSSQSYVINAVAAGRSLVVEGPPGTGKSQTISNVIATLAAQGKSVLFVAEKRAAIEAVHKRLEQVGLGELSLDLHGTKLKKRDLAASLARSLNAVGEAGRPTTGRLHAELAQLRSHLVTYENELHAKQEPWGKSYFEVLEEASELAELPACQLSDAVVDAMTDDAQLRAQTLFSELRSIENAADMSSPWNTIAIANEAQAEDLVGQVGRIRDHLLPDLSSAVAAAEPTVPAISGLTTNEIGSLLRVHDQVVDVESKLGSGIWELDLPDTHAALSAKRAFLPGPPGYREAKKKLAELSGSKFRRGAALSGVEQAIGVSDTWEQMVGEAPQRLAVAPELERTHQEFVAGASTLALADPGILDSALPAAQRLTNELSATERTAFLRGQEAARRAELQAMGVSAVVELVDGGYVASDQASAVLRRSVLDGAIRRIERKSSVLDRFDGSEHRAQAAQYAARDRQHIESAVERIKRAVAERIVETRNAHPDQNALIEKESKKKTRHRSLRQLQDDAGEVLTSLKPCWMMSPLMVAQTLPARPVFDYVVFDEASQIPPADAISSLLRGKNVVVAGDRRQLPPSAFFDSGGSGEVDEYDEDADSLTSGYESLLDVVSVALPVRMLQWHYRSNDDRLIALSNDHIYDGGLTTFPGAEEKSPVRIHRVEHVPTEKGEVKSNSTEVAKVVELMVEHARERPEMSLGVIAFGQTHASSIEDELRETLVELADKELDEYFDEGREERVFVKNIERVQGDERDAIILTIGYGRDLSGKVPLRFGPVNQDGGERRINVAASRARSRMDVVSSIGSQELNVDASTSGPRLLRDLIRFAETAGAETGAAAITHPLNPFELAVKYELEELGLNPISQYGCSGYRIDFALPHPANDGRMVLAVEADGASYHSSHTARDRDRLRQSVLEAKGWRFHRIWSTAFFRDPKREALLVKEAFDRALRGDSSEPLTPFVDVGEPIQSQATAAKPRLIPGRPITEYKHRELVALAKWVTNNGERLLTDEQIHEVMKAELGFKRLGSRINEAFDRAIRDAGVGN